MKVELELRAEQQQKMIASPQLIQSLNVLQYSSAKLDEHISRELMENPVLEESYPAYEETFSGKYRIDNLEGTYGGERITLKDYLRFQVGMMNLTKSQTKEVLQVIEYIDDSGILRKEHEEAGMDPEAIKIVQSLEPYGVGARTINECFVIQMRMGREHSPVKEKIIMESLERLVYGRFKEISKEYGITVDEAMALLEEVRQMNPRPGDEFDWKTPEYVMPDVFVRQVEDRLEVRINSSFLPSLKIDNYYHSLLEKEKINDETRAYVMEKIRRAELLIESIDRRNKTLYDTASSIVAYQKEFFSCGEEGLRPLTYRMVAEKIGLHETTVCRCVNGKYMQTARGTFAMKYFFPSGTKGNVSSVAVKKMIVHLLSDETLEKIYSDSEIAEYLSLKGAAVSRRTVAKYREALGIPNSYERKRWKRVRDMMHAQNRGADKEGK